MSVLDSINKYAVSNIATEDAYGELRDIAAGLSTSAGVLAPEVFMSDCHDGECSFMEAHYRDDPKAKHEKGKRAGDWKFRTYLPRAYSTAKSTLHKGLEAGIDPTGLGKTELEKATRGTKPAKTPKEQAASAWATLYKKLHEMESDDRESMCRGIQTSIEEILNGGAR